MNTVIIVGNVVAALASVVFTVMALVSPRALAGSVVSQSGRYYVLMFVTRSLPIAGGVIAAMFAPVGGGGVILVLMVAAVSQLGDVFIGVSMRKPGQIAGAGVCALIHVASIVHIIVV